MIKRMKIAGRTPRNKIGGDSFLFSDANLVKKLHSVIDIFHFIQSKLLILRIYGK